MANKIVDVDIEVNTKKSDRQVKAIERSIYENNKELFKSLNRQQKKAEIARQREEELLKIQQAELEEVGKQLRNAEATEANKKLYNQYLKKKNDTDARLVKIQAGSVEEALKQEDLEKQRRSSTKNSVYKELDRLTSTFGDTGRKLKEIGTTFATNAKEIGVKGAALVSAFQLAVDGINKVVEKIKEVFNRMNDAMAIAGYGSDYDNVYKNMTGQLNSGLSQAEYYAMQQLGFNDTSSFFETRGFLTGTASGEQLEKDFARFVQEYTDMADSGLFESMQEVQVARAEIQRKFEEIISNFVINNQELIKNVLGTVAELMPIALKSLEFIGNAVLSIAKFLGYREVITTSDVINNYGSQSNANNITFNNNFSGSNQGEVAANFNNAMIRNFEGGN